MSSSLTWQSLPPMFLEPVLLGRVSLAQASELWDRYLLTPDGQAVEIPDRLMEAAEVIWMGARRIEVTVH